MPAHDPVKKIRHDRSKSGPGYFLPVPFGADKIVLLVRFYRENSGAILVWGPGNFLITGMNAPDRSGRVLLGLAHPLSYRPRAVGRGRAGTE
ncbi:MAG: hypothetical protein Q8S57_03255 [Methanoregula sp.]|nr:hypothetical protein [Methanoregula sp.]